MWPSVLDTRPGRISHAGRWTDRSPTSVRRWKSTDLQAEPLRQILDLGAHRLCDRLREPHVLVDRVHAQDARLPVGDGVQLPDQAVAVEDRQGEVAEAALGRRLVHLQD